MTVGLGNASLGLFTDGKSQLGTKPPVCTPHVGRQEGLLLNQGLSFRNGDSVRGSDVPFEVRKRQACPVSLRQRDAVILNVVAGSSDDLPDGVGRARKRRDQVAPEDILISGAAESAAVLLRQVI